VALGPTGFVDILNARFHYAGNAKDKAGYITHSFRILYDRDAWKDDHRVSLRPYTMLIDYQWHPEFKMDDSTKDRNPSGLQVLSASTHPDSLEKPQ
jgi:hypothetical protein